MEEMYNTIAYGLAIILALAIVLIPVALLVLLVIWLFKKVLKPKEKKQPKAQPAYTTANQQKTDYGTEWKWNQQRQLWEHPLSEKVSTSGTEYRYSKAGQTTATAQQPKEATNTTYSFKRESIQQDSIPHTSWKAPQGQQPTAATGKDHYVMPSPGKVPGYKQKLLLTKNEWHEHKKLRDYAAKKGLFVCPKVRLLDLVTPYGNGKEYMTRFHKVQAKHVDFVLVDEGMHIRAIVELDDSSHDEKERQERDQFVDDVLTSVGYTVIHTRCVTEETLSRL